MNYKLLYLLVEGDDDERFFKRIVVPKLEEKYNVIIWKYAQEKNTKIDNFLKSIKAMGAEYIYVVDINHEPCVTRKKQNEIQNKELKNNLDVDKIIVVIKEIESWYLAGLDTNSKYKLDIVHPFEHTNDIDKKQFNDLIPKKFDSRINFMIEILNNYSIETAVQKNKSFKYFIERYNL